MSTDQADRTEPQPFTIADERDRGVETFRAIALEHPHSKHPSIYPQPKSGSSRENDVECAWCWFRPGSQRDGGAVGEAQRKLVGVERKQNVGCQARVPVLLYVRACVRACVHVGKHVGVTLDR